MALWHSLLSISMLIHQGIHTLIVRTPSTDQEGILYTLPTWTCNWPAGLLNYLALAVNNKLNYLAIEVPLWMICLHLSYLLSAGNLAYCQTTPQLVLPSPSY